MEYDFQEIPAERLVELFRTAKAMHSVRAKILKTHFNCQNHTATARHLAEMIGYKNHNAINLQYGKFVKELAMEYGVPSDQHDFDWLFFLMDFVHSLHGECQLKLRKNTVLALQELGW